MIYVVLTMGVAIAALSYFLRNSIRENGILERTINELESVIEVLEDQNETLTKAAKSYNPDYDINSLFSGGY